MAGTPTRNSGVSFSAISPPATAATRASQGLTTPASRHASAYWAKRGSLTVKYWAPWSNRASPCRREQDRPPGLRPLSNTVTSKPASPNARAHDKPATPAPTTAARGASPSTRRPRGGRATMFRYAATSSRFAWPATGRSRTVPVMGFSGENGRSNWPRHHSRPP